MADLWKKGPALYAGKKLKKEVFLEGNFENNDNILIQIIIHCCKYRFH